MKVPAILYKTCIKTKATKSE